MSFCTAVTAGAAQAARRERGKIRVAHADRTAKPKSIEVTLT